MYRLTVHVTDVPRAEVRTGRKIKNASGKWVEEVKQKIHNVLSYECRTRDEIAKKLNINGSASYVRVSQLKKQAINKLIENVDHSQVIDFL